MIRRTTCFLCALMLLFTGFAYGTTLLDKVVAIVNKDVITWSDLYKTMEFEASEEMKALGTEERSKIFRESEKFFLETLIDMRLQLQEAEKVGIFANKEEVDRVIAGIKGKYSLADDQFFSMIKKEGFTPEEYRKKLAEQITINRIVDQEVRSKIVVTETDVNGFLMKKPEIVSDSEGYAISHIFLSTGDNREETEKKARGIYDQIMKGENFGTVAKQFSEDSSARSGGDLGFVRTKDLSKEFINVLVTMETGDVSEPFWTGRGVHILKVNDKRSFKDPAQTREMVRQQLLEERFKTEYRNCIRGLREKSYIEIKL